MEILKSQEFVNVLVGETAVYALIVAGILDEGSYKIGVVEINISRTANDNVMSQLLKKLKEYEDVFSIREAG